MTFYNLESDSENRGKRYEVDINEARKYKLLRNLMIDDY